jgi:fumarylacetoacetase
LENLPLGVFRRSDGAPRVGVAIGDHALDLAAAARRGLLDGLGLDVAVFEASSLNAVLGRGREVWSALRSRVRDLLSEPGSREVVEPLLASRMDLTMLLPIEVADFADFYASIHHATNMGLILRPGGEPLMPNWRHLPVGYHGRSSTVVVSGTPVTRPCGLIAPGGGTPALAPSRMLDIELEVGAVVGTGNPGGRPIAPDEFADHVFGFVLLNDWSARDIQAYEYQPLGPFLGKSFATSISPWVVPLEALRAYLVPGPPQDPPPDPYLRSEQAWAVDLDLAVDLNGQRVASTNFASMYWTLAQALAHLTVNGAVVRTGDLLGSGTVSGPDPGTYGSLMELTWRGRDPLPLADGSSRTFLEDGDTVSLTGWCQREGRPRIGFGEVAGTVVPARG